MPTPAPPPQHPYSEELALALQAVHSASVLTKAVLRSINHGGAASAQTKADDSPVTVADFAAQALLIHAIHAVYPDDTFVGEESADALRSNEDLADRVWDLVQQAASPAAPPPGSGAVQHVQTQAQALAFPHCKADMLDAIDLGTGASTGAGRVWVLDPVDGTATFLEGRQYAVCLALLVDGAQQLGVTGCPNLALDVLAPLGAARIHEDLVDEAGHGVVLSAVRGHGTYVRSMHVDGLGDARRLDHADARKDPSALDFVESALGSTSLSQGEHRAVAESLGATWPGTVVWSQQLKYVALALGATDVMVRLPKTQDRFTHVWDHAGGQLLFLEAGGVIRDLDGGDIDFGQGRKIQGHVNFGMVAAMPWAFDRVHAAVREVLARRTRP